MHHLTWPCQDINHITADTVLVLNANSSHIALSLVLGYRFRQVAHQTMQTQTQGLSLQQTLKDICTAHEARHREKVHTSSRESETAFPTF